MMSRNRIRTTQYIDDFLVRGKLLCKVGSIFVVYRKGCIYNYIDLQNRYISKIELPISKLKRILCRFRVIERTLRLEPRVAIALTNNEFIFSYAGKIYNVNLDSGKIVVEHQFREGMNNVLSFCSYEAKKGQRGIVYGEYWPNKNKEAVAIYERSAQMWRKVYEFPAGRVKHIHQVVYDSKEHCFWVSTGDSDSETAIWKASIDFKDITAVYEGKQQYRTCFFISEDGVFSYPTDSPIENNHFFVINRGEIKSYDMPGPCIFGRSVKNLGYIMSTSVECDPEETWKTGLFRDRLAKGVMDRSSHLFFYDGDNEFKEIASFRKDFWRMVLLFGNIMFPDVEDDEYIYFTGQALVGIDGNTGRIRKKMLRRK